MEFIHEPVLLQEVLEWMDVKPDGVYCDGTLGGGGHSGAMLRLSGGTATLYGIDRDMTAIEAATARLREFPGFHALHGNFHDGKALLMAAGAPKLDGVLLDLGVSSPQLDRGERGFSYHEDAPLDMRMDVSQGITAADLLNSASEQELCRIIRDYGEEKWAARIAQMICEHRAKKPMETTFDLVHAVDAAIPKAVRRKDDGHPARRTFQAIRIAVNDELDPLDKAICDFVDCLKPGGRIGNVNYLGSGDYVKIPRADWGVGMGHKLINGGLMPGGRLRMEKLAALMTSGRLDVKPLITHVFDGWDKLPQALQLMKDKPQDLIKPVVRL